MAKLFKAVLEQWVYNPKFYKKISPYPLSVLAAKQKQQSFDAFDEICRNQGHVKKIFFLIYEKLTRILGNKMFSSLFTSY